MHPLYMNVQYVSVFCLSYIEYLSFQDALEVYWHFEIFGMIDMISTLWYLVGPVIDNFD